MGHYGYKARALAALQDKGLPVYPWQWFPNHHGNLISSIIGRMVELGQRWALRTDAPEADATALLPLYGSNVNTQLKGFGRRLNAYSDANPDHTFILSHAPDDDTREANIVCWRDNDYLFGEINFGRETLRKAWVGGKLQQFVITGGPGDAIRNWHLLNDGELSNATTNVGRWAVTLPRIIFPKQQPRLDFLRKIRELIQEEGYEYEVTVAGDGFIAFWQEAAIPAREQEQRRHLMLNCFKEI